MNRKKEIHVCIQKLFITLTIILFFIDLGPKKYIYSFWCDSLMNICTLYVIDNIYRFVENICIRPDYNDNDNTY